ncbi:MAG TPA: hypothetical protein VJ846_04570, partial [Sphingomicrobium sp.]|nr:hypothetical protein [Sphingomicrobium sp.]
MSLCHNRDPVGHRQRLLLIVRHVNDGRAEALLQLLDLDLHGFAQLLVERPEWLVHQENRRFEHDCSRDCHPLLLAAGQFVWVAPGIIRKLDEVERTANPFGPEVLADAAHLQGEGDIFGDGQMREQGIALEDHPDIAAIGRYGRDVAPAND